MAANPEWKGKTELTSWKEIAEFLEVSVRTAQRYESDLSLPVRRLGGEKGGRVAATVADLTTWKARNASAKWWQNQRLLQTYAVSVTAVSLILALVIARDLQMHWSVGKPHMANWESSTLVVKDERGRELWRYLFPWRAYLVPPLPAWHGDLDGDGQIESLIPYFHDQRESEGAFLYAFSESGAQIWRMEPKSIVADRQAQFDRLYVLREYKVFDSPQRDGTKWVAAAFVHHYEFPSLLLVVDSKGKVRGEYWHSGHLNSLHVGDLDRDGKAEIVAAGTSRGYSQAVLEVFDAELVAGAETLPPGHPNQLIGFAPGTEKARVRFERSRLNRLTAHFNMAYKIDGGNLPGDAFQVSVREAFATGAGYLVYIINPDLTLTRVTASESLRNSYVEYSMKNPSAKPLGPDDLENLRTGFHVEWAGGAVAEAPPRP